MKKTITIINSILFAVSLSAQITPGQNNPDLKVKYDKVILGISTWGEGDLQDDWEDVWADFCNIDFNGKTVSLFGLGDQEGYADEFVDALGTLYEQVKDAGADVVGFTSSEGYEHDASKAEIDGKFVGLVVDEDNQDELTQERIEQWIINIKTSIL